MPTLMIDGTPVATIDDQTAELLRNLAAAGGLGFNLETAMADLSRPDVFHHQLSVNRELVKTIETVHTSLRLGFIIERQYVSSGRPKVPADMARDDIARVVRGY